METLKRFTKKKQHEKERKVMFLRPDEKLESVDAAFASIKENPENKEAYKAIEDCVNDIFHKKVHVSIVNTRPNDQLFVMCITPSQSYLDMVVDFLIQGKPDQSLRNLWVGIPEWNIEIDAKILQTKSLDLTTRELTALLLHELGHMVFSESIPQRMSRVLRFELAQASIGTRSLFFSSIFRPLLSLPVLNACCFQQVADIQALRKEMQADLFAVKYGYGKDLEDAFTKFINTPKIRVRTGKDPDNDMREVYKFSEQILNDFQHRKGHLAKQKLWRISLAIPSRRISGFISAIANKFVHENQNLNIESVVIERAEEQATRLVNETYMKEFFDFKWKRAKRFDPRIIDYIEMESRNIKSNDDKMLLVNYIYTKIDLINYYINILQNPEYAAKYEIQDSMETLLRYKSRLEKLRQYVVDYRVPQIRYGLDIQYPEGYEG